ncbi:MAG: acetoacetate--CoA ligase [Gammaproteobacteria bacterium]|nr:acetoacetate--CoA ligase [Gammaproteobacteria bacterium]
MVQEGDLLWTPSPARIAASQLTKFLRWLAEHKQVRLSNYTELQAWSVANLEAFWEAVWQYFDIKSTTPYECVLKHAEMPGAKWFPGAHLNFAEHVLRNSRGPETALHFAAEHIPYRAVSWNELADQVTRLAARLREYGVKPGDRVASFMPNIPETIVAFLATASLGAIWSSCSPDFGVRSVLDRFSQIEPTVLFCVDGYNYGGKTFDRRAEALHIIEQLPSLKQVVFLPYIDAQAEPPVSHAAIWPEIMAHAPAAPLEFTPVPFDHPLWIVYSSGTTGLPKAIVHSHGGITLEMHKGMSLQINLRPGATMFFYTTSGWIMWNVLMSALVVGASSILYDGNPSAPDVDVLWRLAAEHKATIFGGSPTYVSLMQKNGIVPKAKYDYAALEGVLLSGSPVTPESMVWLYENVKEDLWVTSQSGGTDISSGFVSGSCTLPVYAGEIQAAALAVDVHAFNDAGESVIDEVGELVVCKPMPSMPICFWNDRDGHRYRESYFEVFPGYWRHGDFFKVNARGGCYIQGRSDSTLNRYGVRIGTAEIYRTLEAIEELQDSIIVNLDLSGGRFFMPLFVQLKPGRELTPGLVKKINEALREQCSPRHVPDRIYAVEAVPYTLTGKKLEVPVRRILMGYDIAKAVSRDAMMNPASIDYFIDFAGKQTDFER